MPRSTISSIIPTSARSSRIRLIQRLVTSNPSPAYVGRVAAAFANNGSGVRGDMKAVVKAILLDPEARDPAMMDQPAWGQTARAVAARGELRARLQRRVRRRATTRSISSRSITCRTR